MGVDSGFVWDLDFDASWFVPLPAGDADRIDADAARAWVEGALARYSGEPAVDQLGAELLRATAEALLSQAEAGVTRLWFAPVRMYSDLLVTISIARADGQGSATNEDVFDDARFSAGFDVVPLRTETHGSGFVVRRSTQVEGDRPLLITQWTARLNDGTWGILVDTLGTTLPAFALFEEQLMRLILGIRLPRPVGAE
jgi:hypothetical protein